jgi:serine/threonine protein kinase
MAPEFHHRVRQLFDEALEQPEGERLLFVEKACGGDATLLQAVERLLRARGASASFLESNSQGGERIGRYLIRGELGRGAMGVVYDAVDPMIGRSVAVKVIHLKALTEPSEAEFLRERLFREARSAGQLFHPGIVIILDVGQQGDSAFITMERVDGPSLQQILTPGRALKTGEALGILRQTAAALDYAHQRGVVHRDIKPANIMLHNGADVKVADFGIAKIMSAQTTLTGLVMGTPSYMSPEQIEAKAVDGRSDQFSLAVLAYELLTGVRPFVADSIAALTHVIVYGQRPSAHLVNPLLPPEVDEVLRRGMARLPEERFPSCLEFTAELEAPCNRPPMVDPAATDPDIRQAKAPAGKRRSIRFVYLAGIPVIVLALVLAFLMYKYSNPRANSRPAPVELKNPPAPTVVAVQAPPAVKQFSADPPSIEAGTPARLSWEVTGANEVAIDQGIGKVEASGTLKVQPSVPTTYVITASGSGKNDTAKVSVDVTPKSVATSTRALQVYRAAVAKRSQGQLSEAVALFRQAAELGEPGAMAELGESYRTGEGVTQDDIQAILWFHRAAGTGNSFAMVALGYMYSQGDGVTASDEEAVKWYQKAADRDNPAGIYDLANMYENGLGVPRSLEKATQLYQRAAKLGHIGAQTRLSELQPQK